MQKMIVSIPEPCHENWDKMSATQQGRFCNACAKEVIDFSVMSDAEMINYFSKLTTANVCGRVYTDQLDRAISRPQEIKKRKFWYWNYVAMLLFSFSKLSAAKAQGKLLRVPETENAPKPSEVDNQNRILSGSVVDNAGKPVPFASITKYRSGISADAFGNYSIRVKTGDSLTIIGYGFAPKTIHVSDSSNIKTVLEASKENIRGEIVVAVAGGIRLRDMDYVNPLINILPKHVAQFIIKDDKTGLPIPQASIIIQNADWNDPKTFVADKNGRYKMKRIKEYEKYEVKANAEGYNVTEFTIEESDFKDRKGDWEIRLAKKETPAYQSLDSVIVQTGYPIRCRPSRGVAGGVTFVTADLIKKDSLFTKIKAIVAANSNKLKIAPDPVQRGTTFNLSLDLKKPGTNLLRITNDAGGVILQKQIEATGKAQTESITADASWAAGIYYIFIIDAGDKLLTKGSFIVQ